MTPQMHAPHPPRFVEMRKRTFQPFVGDWDRYVMAYDVESGEELWQTRLTHMTNGFPITYAVDGTQYVAIGTGPSIGGSSWATLIPLELLPREEEPTGQQRRHLRVRAALTATGH